MAISATVQTVKQRPVWLTNKGDHIGENASTRHCEMDLPKTKLLSYHEIPKWYQDNSFIRNGYRPVSGSISECMASWWYLHNETMNIYTHLIPAVVVLVCGIPMYFYFTATYPLIATGDLVVFGFFMACVTACFALSANYHTMMNHSEKISKLCLRCDFFGIVVHIFGSFISGIKMGFFCQPGLRLLYWAMVRDYCNSGKLKLTTGVDHCLQCLD